ncbi:chromobox protein homolog 3-like [Drosophila subpulchrella]|uniref:chromobox protein homolog 3-like n=1 Tax=Drosophila subpulchrella TaxID=1486046 RepID=UPI0018A17071|nr:chromobox protein homolog 3-like [Drosophila subpulchrella]
MDEYSVERVEGKRMVNGRKEYYLKWKGYPRSENTWEPVDHLDCPHLIANYEESLKITNKEATVCIPSTTDSIPVPKERKNLTGFERGLEPLKILGATDASGQLMFLMKWKGCDHADLVSAKLANIRYPQKVIKFYEERLTWYDGSEDGHGNGDSVNLASFSGGLGSARASGSVQDTAPDNVSNIGGGDEEEPETARPAGTINQVETAKPEESYGLNNGQLDAVD